MKPDPTQRPHRPGHPDRPSHPEGDGQAHRPAGAASRGARRLLQWLTEGRDLTHIARRLGRDEQHLKEQLADLLQRLGADSPKAALQALQGDHSAPSQPDGFEEIDDETAGQPGDYTDVVATK